MRGLENVTIGDILSNYIGSGMYIVLFIIGIIFVYLENKKESKNFFIYYTILSGIIIINPLVLTLFTSELQNDPSVYYRFIWILPVVLLIAYMGTRIIIKVQGGIKKSIVACLLVIVLAISGTPIFAGQTIVVADNMLKVPSAMFTICDIIHTGMETDRQPVVFVTDSIGPMIRQYDPSIIVYYGDGLASEVLYEGEEKVAVDILGALAKDEEVGNKNAVWDAIQKLNLDYIITGNNSNLSMVLESTKGFLIGNIEDKYLIYKLNDN